MIAELNNRHTMSWLWLLANAAAKETDDSKTKQILDFLNNNPMIGWGIAGFAVMALATAAIAKWAGNLDKIIGFAQKYLFHKKPEITEAQRQQARADLIEILLKQVVKRLENSLHHKIRIDLRREEQRQRVGQGNLAPIQQEQTEQTPDNFIKRIFNPFTDNTPPEAVSTHKSTQELFERENIQGRLLILGEPGSGKTNELLVLARDLLIQAQQSPDKPIPVIFELSEWKAGNSEQGFADWLAQQLLDKYSIPPTVSKYWIRQKQLLPLLDGLDELRRVDGDDEVTSEDLDKHHLANQIRCVRDINTFLDLFSIPLVVCCRRQEYEVIEAQGEYLKRLNGAIYIQALENEQIHEYLQKLNRDSLWKALQNQPTLMELAHSPLFLLILMVAYKGQNISNTEELLDEYIHKQLHDLNNQGAYPPGKASNPEQTNHYLSWLATKLESVGTTEFLIEKLQPSWLDTSKARTQYRWIVGLFIGLLYGLVGGSSIGLLYGQNYGLLGGLFLGLLVWLVSLLNLGRFEEKLEKLIKGHVEGLSIISTAEKLSFSWNSFYRAWLIIGLFFGLSFVLTFWLKYGLLEGLISGLICGPMCGLLLGLFKGIKISEIDVRDKIIPNQGIRDSIKNGLFVGLIYGVFVGLAFGLTFGLIDGLIFGLVVGFIYGLLVWAVVGLMCGLEAVFKHISLRIVLYQSGCSPWNYAIFLEHAENLRFIQRTGGRYRFVHDLLRKRFAATLKQP